MQYIIYIIILESIVCGLMINRTLCSRWLTMWHLPVYILIKTACCALMVAVKGTYLITVLSVAFSILYSLLCFNDKISRKLAVCTTGTLCIGISNLFKFSYLSRYNVTQELEHSEDVLESIICISFSMLIFTVLTIVATNIICRVRWKIVAIITGVMLLVLTFSAAVYRYIHWLVDTPLNGIYAAYAMFFLLPAIVLLYFFEAVIFSHRGNFFKE